MPPSDVRDAEAAVPTDLVAPAPPGGDEIGGTVSAGGVATNHHDHGAGPPVLLLHGSGPGVSAWANWRFTLPALAPRFRVLAPDLLGFGFTEVPADVDYTPAAWLDHLLAYLDALDVGPVHVVGNSFGGALALHLATRHPDRVRRLVLMGSAGTPFPITDGLDEVWGYHPAQGHMRALLERFVYDGSRITDDLARLRHAAASRPEVTASYAAMFPAPRQRHVDALAVAQSDLASLPHETLVLHGRDDAIIPLSASLRLHELIVASDLHVFGRCGHWVQIEAKDRFNALVTRFLSEGLAG
jgi:2-hydroxymuconate-semialdehyde hydrolase